MKTQSRMPVSLGTSLVAVVLLGFVNGSVAQPTLPERVSLAIPACDQPPVSWAALVGQLEIELRGLNVRLDRDAQHASTVASIVVRVPHCSPSAGVLMVSLVNLETRRVMQRTIPIPPPDDDQRVRVAALAIAELLREQWPSLSESVTDRLDALEEAVAETREIVERHGGVGDERFSSNAEAMMQARSGIEAVADEARGHEGDIDELHRTTVRISPPPGALVGARLVVRGFLGGGAALVGPGLAAEFPLGPVRVGADASIEWGAAAHELGEVRLLEVRGAVALLMGSHIGPLSMGVGPFVGLAWTRAEGKPLDPMVVSGSQVDGAMVELGGRVNFHVRASTHVLMVFSMDAGYGAGGVDARGVPMGEVAGRIVKVGGAFLAASIGLAFEP